MSKLETAIDNAVTRCYGKYVKRGDVHRRICQELQIPYNPKLAPLLRAALILKGYVPVTYYGRRVYRHTQLKD